MIKFLKIKNFALIEKAEIELSPKFNVVTGETGAGKSLFMSALALLAGERATKNVIRANCDRCDISAEIYIELAMQEKVANFLTENAIDYNFEDGICLRRVIGNTFNRITINDVSVSLKLLKDFSIYCFDFNQVDDDLSLNSPSRQRELLDRFANIDMEDYLQIFNILQAKQKQLHELKTVTFNSDEVEKARELVNSFEELNPTENEEDELQTRYKILENSKELLELSTLLTNNLTINDNSLLSSMAEINRYLNKFSKLAPTLGDELTATTDVICESLRNLSNQIENFALNLELDGDSLIQIEERLSNIFRLKRRFGPSYIELFENYNQAKKLLERLEFAKLGLKDLENEILEQQKKLKSAGEKISTQRKVAAEKLNEAMLKELSAIGFKKCQMQWKFTECEANVDGIDELDIYFSANLGEPLLPLREIASSGERSRLFLAIKSVLAKIEEKGTIIFDEIDSNIGGETANKVAQSLSELSKNAQIRIISHLPQVAVKADCHILLAKSENLFRTISEAKILNLKEKVNEISRMLGGGTSAQLHAKNLLNLN